MNTDKLQNWGTMKYGLYLETSIGRLYLEQEGEFLVSLGKAENSEEGVLQETLLLRRAAEEIIEFLEGSRRSFDIPIHMKGTDFQKKVWQALLEIPYGETRSYGEIAARIGCPKGARAVGQACNRNPIMIIVPCHRVIGGNGRLVGFGGGLDIKEKLLTLEQLGK